LIAAARVFGDLRLRPFECRYTVNMSSHIHVRDMRFVAPGYLDRFDPLKSIGARSRVCARQVAG
jgi:hypothetical protein